MSLRDDLLPTLVSGYQIVEDHGLRQVRIIVRTRTWSSGDMNVGVPTISDREILPRPRVEGIVGDPVLKVGPIVPASAALDAGTFTPAMLNPSDAPGIEYFYVAIWPDGVERPYKLMKLTAPEPFRYMLEFQSLDRRMPF